MVSRTTWIDTTGPLKWGKHTIRDLRNHGPALTVEDIIVKSSNIGTARVAMMIGADRQQSFLSKLGLFSPMPVELIEAKGARPLLPKKWSEIHTMTVSYGHGLSASPLHLATAYASLLNGGVVVRPTLLKRETFQPGPRVVSENTSEQMRSFLRQVVQRGTASLGEVCGVPRGRARRGQRTSRSPRGAITTKRSSRPLPASFRRTIRSTFWW